MLGEVSKLGQMWRGSVCRYVYEQKCCSNSELFVNPKTIRNITGVPVLHSHFPSKETKQFITSPPVHCPHNVYSILFTLEAFGFTINSCVNYLYRVF